MKIAALSTQKKNFGLGLCLLGFLLVALLAQPPQSVAAQQPTPSDDEVNRIAKQMYCPVCENIPLDVCPTQACAQWRSLIRLKLSEGLSDEQIKDYFVQQYGDRVLDVPPLRGLNWLVFVLPPLFFIIGIWVVYRVMRSMNRNRQAALVNVQPDSSGGVPSADPYLAQVEEELKRRQEKGL
ncbi:MAG: cytochrome c-type biogenesis protein CcmH [Bellilinea sp.]